MAVVRIFALAFVLFAACDAVLGLDHLVADREPDGACPSCGRPRVPRPDGGAYTIDAFEVTFAQYRAWLDTKPSVTGQTPECSWNDSFEPGIQSARDAFVDAGIMLGDGGECAPDTLSTLKPNRPVVCIDWCDAVAFCAAMNKRLCSRLNGGTLDVTDQTPASDPNKDEWFRACSNAGANAYPYGSTYRDGACNDQNLHPVEVGTFPECQGGVPGVFDMSGNVDEWENACTSFNAADPVQNCLSRGGAFFSDSNQLACAGLRDHPRGSLSDITGFRCCAD